MSDITVFLADNTGNHLEIWHRHREFLPDDVKGIAKINLNSIDEYNKYLCSKQFWESIKTEYVFIIQHDSAILRTGIEEFLGYDFIGAPIKHIPFPAMNGGFSLRKKTAMLRVIENIPYTGGNEDMYFCNGLKQLGGNLPTFEVANKFSCETYFTLGTLGYHAIEKWLTPEQCEQIKNQYK